MNTTATPTGPRMLVNNTSADLRLYGIEAAIWESARNGTPLPEEIADTFAVEIVNVGGEDRIIVRWA